MSEHGQPARPSTPTPQLIGVVGAKGGVGTTTVAVNLAVSLRRRTEAPVLLLDWDFAGGSVPLLLGVTPKHSMQSILSRPSAIDPYLLMQTVAPSPSGISVLANGYERWHQRESSSERLETIVALVAATTSVVVADLGRGTAPEIQPILHHATAIVIVTTPRIDSFIATVRLLQFLAPRLPATDRLRLVVNQASEGDRSVIELAERHVNRRIDVIVPKDDLRCQDAAEQGRPLVMLAPSSPIAKRMEQLADLFLSSPSSHHPATAASRFSHLFTGLTLWRT